MSREDQLHRKLNEVIVKLMMINNDMSGPPLIDVQFTTIPFKVLFDELDIHFLFLDN